MVRRIKSFWIIIKKNDKKLLSILIFNIIFTSLSIFPPIILSKIIFDELANGTDIKKFVITASILLTISLISNLLIHFFDKKTEIRGQELMVKLKDNFNFKTMELDYYKLSEPKILEMREAAKQAIEGSNFIDLIRNIKSIFSNVLMIMGLLYILINADFIVMLATLGVVVLNTLVNSSMKKVQYKFVMESLPFKRQFEYFQNICSDFKYGKEIRINKAKKTLMDKVHQFNVESNKYGIKIVGLLYKSLYFSNITDFIQSMVLYLVLGYKVLILKALSIGDFSMYINAITQFKSSLLEIIEKFIDIQISSSYIEHYSEYMNLQNEQYGDYKPDKDADFKIEFRNVSFKYPSSDKYVLKDINLTIENKEKTALVGMNGAGKTTLIKLLLRLYKLSEGEILINNININEYSEEQYNNLFSVVFQDFKLFAFTMKENISFSLQYDEDKAMKIIETVGLDEKIKRLSKGFDSYIFRIFDEEGIELSGGEAQKFAIARAIYREAPICILDEPTAALDPISEYEIFKIFDKLVENRTALYISHRLSSTRACDNIVVFKDGTIVQYGNHESLIKQGGIYADMYNKQSQYYIENNEKEISYNEE